MRREFRHPCRRRDRRRQSRHDDRLPARRREIPQRDGSVPRAAARRQEQEEDPMGQRATALRAIATSFVPPAQAGAQGERRNGCPGSPPSRGRRRKGDIMKIGFIGVGNIGAPIAGQLLNAGHDLTVNDLRREAASVLLAAGAAWADTPAEIAAGCDVVATCLPGPKEMEAVCLGQRGLVEHLKPGALYIDHTTNAPALVRHVHALLAEKNVAMLDAPVSGGMEGAQSRDLLVMAGGDPDTFERARPPLEAVAKRVMHTGGIGTGSIAKIMHNSATFTLDLVMAECWTTGVKAGIDAATLVRVFNEAALGHMMNLKVRLPATYLRGDFDPRFSLALARKDLGLALELARETDTPMRLAAICEGEMQAAIDRGWADRDASIFLTLQEERAGVEVRLPGGEAGARNG